MDERESFTTEEIMIIIDDLSIGQVMLMIDDYLEDEIMIVTVMILITY